MVHQSSIKVNRKTFPCFPSNNKKTMTRKFILKTMKSEKWKEFKNRQEKCGKLWCLLRIKWFFNYSLFSSFFFFIFKLWFIIPFKLNKVPPHFSILLFWWKIAEKINWTVLRGEFEGSFDRFFSYCFTPKTTQWVLFEFVCKKSLSAWDLRYFKLKIRIVLTELFSG